MSILIVESPAKCKKIQSFLDKSYIVKSSVGHIRTLDTKWANTDVKITDDFEPPFVTIKDKHEVVNNLKYASKNRKVILAADDDREGWCNKVELCGCDNVLSAHPCASHA